MIKKIITIIIVLVAVFLFSMIYWRGSDPHSYYSYWTQYPFLENFFVCDTCLTSNKALFATSSETVRGSKGEIIIGRESVLVEIAKTNQDRVGGLSNRSFLDKKTGMLFVFDKIDYHSFWMKDMLIYLDIIFIDQNWQIVAIERNLSPDSFPKTFGGEVKSKYVLEINAGEANLYKFKVGDRIIFLNK